VGPRRPVGKHNGTRSAAQLTELFNLLQALKARVGNNETTLGESRVEREALSGAIAAVKLAQPNHTDQLTDLGGAIAEQKAAVEQLAAQLTAPLEWEPSRVSRRVSTKRPARQPSGGSPSKSALRRVHMCAQSGSTSTAAFISHPKKPRP
jgi:hypothetical protein